ncbi:hypothetical protein SUNI508_08768 [Seiridium unicorne]|uniref:Uncharacterized protein n=1 Tax=Seiridium unicorne TaxID=138068 RepID=A0ABR2URX2_9PEZI
MPYPRHETELKREALRSCLRMFRQPAEAPAILKGSWRETRDYYAARDVVDLDRHELIELCRLCTVHGHEALWRRASPWSPRCVDRAQCLQIEMRPGLHCLWSLFEYRQCRTTTAVTKMVYGGNSTTIGYLFIHDTPRFHSIWSRS